MPGEVDWSADKFQILKTILEGRSLKDFPNLAQFIAPAELQDKSHEQSLNLSDFLGMSGCSDTGTQTDPQQDQQQVTSMDCSVQTASVVLDATGGDIEQDPLASSTQHDINVSAQSQHSVKTPAKKRQKVDKVLSNSAVSVVVSPPPALAAAMASTPDANSHGLRVVSVESLARNTTPDPIPASDSPVTPTVSAPSVPSPKSGSTVSVRSSDDSIFLSTSSPSGSSVTGPKSASKSKSADSGDSVQVTFDSNLMDCEEEDCGECEGLEEHEEEGEEYGEEDEGEDEDDLDPEEETVPDDQPNDDLAQGDDGDWEDSLHLSDLMSQETQSPADNIPAYRPIPEWYVDERDSPEMAHIHYTWYRNRPYHRSVVDLPDGSVKIGELCDDCVVGEFDLTLPQNIPLLADRNYLPLFKLLQHQLSVLHQGECRNSKCQEVGEISYVLAQQDLAEKWPALLALIRWYDSCRMDGLHELSFAMQLKRSRLSDPLQDMRAEFLPCYSGYQTYPVDAAITLLNPPSVVDLSIAEVRVNANIRTQPTPYSNATPVECFSCKVCYDNSPQYWVIYMTCM